LHVVTIVHPETLVRWHRTGFRWYWRWKSRPRGGRRLAGAAASAALPRMNSAPPEWHYARYFLCAARGGADVRSRSAWG
jgi:hypothetical protein